MELQWSRLELGLLCGGFCAGGMRSADALEELSEVGRRRARARDGRKGEGKGKGNMAVKSRAGTTSYHDIHYPARSSPSGGRAAKFDTFLFFCGGASLCTMVCRQAC